MTLNLSQSVLKRRVFNQGVYNSHSRDFMLGQTAPFIKKDGVVLDVGAAVGMYTQFWACLANHVYSFEAVPPVYDQLKLVESKNANVTAFNIAVGAEDKDKVDFYVDDKRLSNSGLRNLVGGQKISVPMKKLDTLFSPDLNRYDRSICFIKIDVEGNELDVLKGGEQLIDALHPTIMCEIYPKFNDGPVINTFNFLFDRGYRCFYNVPKRGLQPVTDPDHGATVAGDAKLISQHDGDFLFTHGSD